MYAMNEILFPACIIPQLRDARGHEWSSLIDHLCTLPESHEEVLAFMLMMIRLNGCLECETDSYRAMRGCNLCALQTLRRYKGPDDELFAAYHQALLDIRDYMVRTGRTRFDALLQAV